ncbi:helix-turn-helix transcriptional regulator [Paenibacillus sp. O199]|uniref:helix-turn-helix domain-containing protein n=1 Tax=Paenibacillus sp. O199 TaxID=1643925 RepID=UPI0007BEE13E|nr:helix-turn-helix transcriptional regulator [Paenibacillus sp. O199]
MRYEPDRCRLKELYIQTGVSQRMVHIITGIAESQLSQYANNKSMMTKATAYTIAKAMRLPNSDLLYTWREIPD